MTIGEFVEYIESMHFSMAVEGDTLSLKANTKKLNKEQMPLNKSFSHLYQSGIASTKWRISFISS